VSSRQALNALSANLVRSRAEINQSIGAVRSKVEELKEFTTNAISNTLVDIQANVDQVPHDSTQVQESLDEILRQLSLQPRRLRLFEERINEEIADLGREVAQSRKRDPAIDEMLRLARGLTGVRTSVPLRERASQTLASRATSESRSALVSRYFTPAGAPPIQPQPLTSSNAQSQPQFGAGTGSTPGQGQPLIATGTPGAALQLQPPASSTPQSQPQFGAGAGSTPGQGQPFKATGTPASAFRLQPQTSVTQPSTSFGGKQIGGPPAFGASGFGFQFPNAFSAGFGAPPVAGPSAAAASTFPYGSRPAPAFSGLESQFPAQSATMPGMSQTGYAEPLNMPFSRGPIQAQGRQPSYSPGAFDVVSQNSDGLEVTAVFSRETTQQPLPPKEESPGPPRKIFKPNSAAESVIHKGMLIKIPASGADDTAWGKVAYLQDFTKELLRNITYEARRNSWTDNWKTPVVDMYTRIKSKPSLSKLSWPNRDSPCPPCTKVHGKGNVRDCVYFVYVDRTSAFIILKSEPAKAGPLPSSLVQRIRVHNPQSERMPDTDGPTSTVPRPGSSSGRASNTGRAGSVAAGSTRGGRASSAIAGPSGRSGRSASSRVGRASSIEDEEMSDEL